MVSRLIRNKVKLSICMSCYLPSEKTFENINLICDEIEGRDDVEFIYFDNGSGESEFFDLCSTFLKLHIARFPEYIKYTESDHNYGVGGGFARVILQATGEYVFMLGDDDIPDVGYIERLLDYLNENDIDLCHQYLKDDNVIDVLGGSWITSDNSKRFDVCRGEVAFRMGALPGCVFKGSLFNSDIIEEWDGKLYPWVSLAFSDSVKTIALLNLGLYINVAPGPPAHLRFQDRIARDSDYGLIERVSYSSLSDKILTNLIYEYRCYTWAFRIWSNISNSDKDLADAMKDTLKSKLNYSFNNSTFVKVRNLISFSKKPLVFFKLAFALSLSYLIRKK